MPCEPIPEPDGCYHGGFSSCLGTFSAAARRELLFQLPVLFHHVFLVITIFRLGGQLRPRFSKGCLGVRVKIFEYSVIVMVLTYIYIYYTFTYICIEFSNWN